MSTQRIEKYIKLANGITMPTLGFGVWQIANGGEAEQAVTWAIDAGYRLIDTAKYYGNEEDVGKAVRASKIPRNEIFVTTKLWVTDGLRPRHAFEASLQRLGLEYIDLYLIHWPFPGKDRAWKVLEEIYKEGLAKAIGVSNYSISDLEKLQKNAEVQPAVNQVEFNPFSFDKPLLDYCQANGIALEAYSPLTRARNLNHPEIAAIAKKYAKSPAQILIRWALQHGTIVIPKSSNQERIRENATVFDFEIRDDDMNTLDALGV